MKTLPDSANLDHLRQQAKDLLPQLRSLRPGATLGDAQALIAETYGFRTWTELKAEVDRRRATPGDPPPDALAVSQAFGLGMPTGPLEPTEQKWAGQEWALTTDRGRWAVRRMFPWIDVAAVETDVRLAESALAAGILTPRPVRSPAGTAVEKVSGVQWRVFEWVAAGPEPTEPADPRHAAAAGRILAKVHGLGLPAAPPVTTWLTCARPEAQWWELQRAAEAAGSTWATQLAQSIPRLVELTALVEPAARAGGVVLSACHFAPDVFRIAGADSLVLTAWDHAGPIPPRWDLAAMLAAWAGGVRDHVNRPAVRAMFTAYAAETGHVPALDLGAFTASVCAHLNWLGSRVRIALEPADRPDRRAAADRAVPWLLAHLPSRATYEEVLAAARN